MSGDDPIYLDHNATTPVLPEVLDAMLPWLTSGFGNPSSSHVYGTRARSAVDGARAAVASLLGAVSEEIVFTSGGTESNNLAIVGSVDETDRPGCVVTSVIEHPATLRPCARLEQRGHTVVRVGVDGDGCVRLDEAAAAIDDATFLVTIMHANNETGVLQPVRALADLARKHGARVHTDAAQSVGKVPVDVRALDVDMLTLAGHKLHAPKGVGALYLRRGVSLVPVVLGASHERGLRPGTENVASIVGLGAACTIASRDQAAVAARTGALVERLHRALAGSIPGLVVHGQAVARLPNTLHLRFPRVVGSALLAAAPEVAASTGSACHDGHEAASSVILAMGVAPAEAIGSVRLTLGRTTTEADVDRAAAALVRAFLAS